VGKEKIVKCVSCNKFLKRKTHHKDAKCKECKNEEKRVRYYTKRKIIVTLTEEEKALLASLNSYPVIANWSGNLGTSGPTTSYKIIEVNGKERIKGAVWLENWLKRQIRKKKSLE